MTVSPNTFFKNSPTDAVSITAEARFLRAFGRAPRVLDFLGILDELKRVHEGIHDTEETTFATRFRAAIGAIDAIIMNDVTRNAIEDQTTPIMSLLRRVDSGVGTMNDVQWRDLVTRYTNVVRSVAVDRNVFMTVRYLPSEHLRWPRLILATDAQAAVEKLKRDDPELYQRVSVSRDQRRKMDRAITRKVESHGLEPGRIGLMGRAVITGKDPVTEERLVYDDDGSRLPIPEFIEKVKKKNLEYGELMNVNVRDIDGLRTIPEERFAELDGDPDGHVALTDDPEKITALTKIYPVKTIDGLSVVSSGRFKGIAVPDLVNRAGRLIEGSLTYYEPETGRLIRREVQDKNGAVNVRRVTEPYVTVSEGRLLLNIQSRGFGIGKWTEARNAVGALTKIIPSVRGVPGTRQGTFYFEPKDFMAVRDALGGVALSHTAAQVIKNYFDDLMRAENAASAKNLSRYDAEPIGMNRQLWLNQKRACAWLEANGDRGICALDTGYGKTSVAIASMLSLEKRGLNTTGNGRFLFVCDAGLTGNLPKEMLATCPKWTAWRLIEATDIVTYSKFVSNRKKDPTYGDDYVAVYFDEAHQYFRSKSSAKYKTAVSLACPRKILLTASPMVKSPKDVLTLASVGTGTDLNTPAGQDIERKFVTRFCETVGSRIVGIKQDPITAKDFRTWVKRNLFFADKRNNAESPLQELRSEHTVVAMAPEVETLYRDTIEKLLAALKDVVRGKFKGRADLAIEASRVKFSKEMSVLTKLSDTPDQIVPGVENPKLNRALDILAWNVSGKSILFTDSTDLAKDTFAKIREQFPGKAHVLGLSDKIIVATPTGEEQVFTARKYVDPGTGDPVPSKEWKVFILGGMQKDPMLMTATLTGSYATGQNLQSFDTVIHLDRDTWSSETMKQRTARAWRSGQQQPVNEYTLDVAYGEPVADAHANDTLDEIRRVIQEMDADLFDRVVLDSQVERLGIEWAEIKKQRSLLHKVNRDMIERALSPYATSMAGAVS